MAEGRSEKEKGETSKKTNARAWLGGVRKGGGLQKRLKEDI